MSFDRLAPHYRWLERVLAGSLLQRARLAHLPVLDRAEHVLLAGEGPGRFLSTLRARRPVAEITVVDRSAAMLRIAKRQCRHQPCRAGDGGGVRFIQADLRTWNPPRQSFDAIVTCCVLDCFGPATLAVVIERLGAAARPKTDWLHVDFAVPASGWKRLRARAVHALMYSTFRFVTDIEAYRVTPPDPWLRAAGFERKRAVTFSAGLIRSEHWRRS